MLRPAGRSFLNLDNTCADRRDIILKENQRPKDLENRGADYSADRPTSE